MKKLNFNLPITNLKGEPMNQGGEKMMMHEIIANMLSIAKPVDSNKAVRQLDVALKLYNSKGEIELDDNDVTMIKKITEASGTSTLIIGQIIKIIEAKPEKKEEIKEEVKEVKPEVKEEVKK